MTVVVFGSVNIDITAYVDRLPQPGATLHAQTHAVGLGGKGANQAVAAERAGHTPTRFIAAVGEDAFGKTARSLLEEYGVSTDNFRVSQAAPTGLALIHVEAAGQNTITVIGGANLDWPEGGPDKSVFDGAKAALFQLETPLPATVAAMQAAKHAGAQIILDPAPAPDGDISHLTELADIIVPNEVEAEALCGIAPVDDASALAAARALLETGCSVAVVKRGAQGLSFAARDGGEGHVAPFEVAAIDTVAAGDCFAGALAVAVAEGQTLRDALRMASAAGALSTTKRGAAGSTPTRAMIDTQLGVPPKTGG